MRGVSRHGVDALPIIRRSKTHGGRSRKLICELEASLLTNPFGKLHRLMASTHVGDSTSAMLRNDSHTAERYVVPL